MKFLHLADLHIGKVVNGFSMLAEQRHAFDQILAYIETHSPQAVVIAGDVYDKSQPGAAAVALYDDFLTELRRSGPEILVIAGNHDSPERLAFAGKLLADRGIHVAGHFTGVVAKVTLADEYGEVDFHLLPFLRPASLRSFYPEEEIESYEAACRLALSTAQLVEGRRNVLVAHQFVTAAGINPERADSEIEPVGSLNNVDFHLFDPYDYVALGHIHGPQRMGRDEVRYAGSPLKYSFSECQHHKGALLVEMGEKGAPLRWEMLSITPLHDMRKIKGPIDDLTRLDVVAAEDSQDYLHVTLTDEGELQGAMDRLRAYYPNVMELVFDNARSRAEPLVERLEGMEGMDLPSLFKDFYRQQNGENMTEEQEKLLEGALEDRAREEREA